MKMQKRDQVLVVRIERGEDVITTLQSLAEAEGIRGAFFHGLGGASYAEIGIYRLSDDKQYHFTEFSGDLEIISINGNIARNNSDEILIHAHASISGNDLQAYGGHVKQLRVAGTCEIFIDTRTGEMMRRLDSDIGLPLLDLDD